MGETQKSGLDAVWQSMLEDTFDRFIEENIGYSEDGLPECHGSGDSVAWCSFCVNQESC